MADHYVKTLELIDDLAQIRAEIKAAYETPPIPTPLEVVNGANLTRPPSADRRLKVLHSRQGFTMQLAKIHATLAAAQITAQATRDAAGTAL